MAMTVKKTPVLTLLLLFQPFFLNFGSLLLHLFAICFLQNLKSWQDYEDLWLEALLLNIVYLIASLILVSVVNKLLYQVKREVCYYG